MEAENSPPQVDPVASTTNEPEYSVMEVTTDSDNKTRKLAVQITFNISGVESASLVSSDKNQIVVSGEGTNSDQLSFTIGIKIDCTATDSEEINTGGGTGMDGSEISSGGGGKSHGEMI